MPPPTPLHASERKLGGFMLGAIALVPVAGVQAFGVSDVGLVAGLIWDWARLQWTYLLEGLWLDSLTENFFPLLLVSLPVGAVFLVPWHLCHLLGRRCWTSAGTLWLWSGIYGLISAGVGSVYLALTLTSKPEQGFDSLRCLVFMLVMFVLGFLITVFGFHAWQRRRREDRTALVADPPADAALPD